MLPILTDFMEFSALLPLVNRPKKNHNKTQHTKQKTPATIENKELKLPGGDINHEPSAHLK